MADTDPLVEAFLDELSQIDEYTAALASGTLTHEDVRATAFASYELLFQMMIGNDIPSRLCDVSASIGERRALAGFPLGALIRAMRSNFRVIWTAMLALAEPYESEALLNNAVAVWDAVEKHIMDAVTAYQQTELKMARERADATALWFSRLLETEGHTAEIVQRAGTILGLDPNGTFLVIVSPRLGDRSFQRAASQLAATGVRCHRQPTAQGEVFVAQLSDRRSRGSLLSEFVSVPCGVAPVTNGLGTVPRSVGLAARVARALGDDATGPVNLSATWLPVVSAEVTLTLGTELVTTCFQPLAGLPDRDRKRILETVRVYLDCSGSISLTADRLNCHRNTILNRLHRFHELVSLDVCNPVDAAVVLIALQIIDQAPPGTLSLGRHHALSRDESGGSCFVDRRIVSR